MKKRKTPLFPSLHRFPIELILEIVAFLTVQEALNLLTTCKKLLRVFREVQTLNSLTKKLFLETIPKKPDLFKWVSRMLTLERRNYVEILSQQQIIFNEFIEHTKEYNPVIATGPFTKCRHIIILMHLIGSLKSDRISIGINTKPPPLPESTVENQEKKKLEFFSVLLAIITHLRIHFTWLNLKTNMTLIKSVIEGSCEYHKNIENTIQTVLNP